MQRMYDIPSDLARVLDIYDLEPCILSSKYINLDTVLVHQAISYFIQYDLNNRNIFDSKNNDFLQELLINQLKNKIYEVLCLIRRTIKQSQLCTSNDDSLNMYSPKHAYIFELLYIIFKIECMYNISHVTRPKSLLQLSFNQTLESLLYDRLSLANVRPVETTRIGRQLIKQLNRNRLYKTMHDRQQSVTILNNLRYDNKTILCPKLRSQILDIWSVNYRTSRYTKQY